MDRSRGVASRQPRTASPPTRQAGHGRQRSDSASRRGTAATGSTSPPPARRPHTSDPSQSNGRRPARSPSPGPQRPTTSPARLVQPQDVTQVFKRFDVNGDGKIDRNEMARVLAILDPVRWTDRNASLLLMSVDKNFDGFIDYAEFVEWVSADGSEQTEFRQTAGMPRSRDELARLEKERKAAAEKGTAAELNKKKALAAHKQDVLKSAIAHRDRAHRIYEELKVKAARASEIFEPAYERFMATSADVAVPAKEIFDLDMKEAWGTDSPPRGQIITAQAMCIVFRVNPSTRSSDEPDYWTAFSEAVLCPKLLQRMHQFDKEALPKQVAHQLSQLCDNSDFHPDNLKHAVGALKNTSKFLLAACEWIHFLSKYHQAGVKILWDRAHAAELEVSNEERSIDEKENALLEARREVARLEGVLGLSS